MGREDAEVRGLQGIAGTGEDLRNKPSKSVHQLRGHPSQKQKNCSSDYLPLEANLWVVAEWPGRESEGISVLVVERSFLTWMIRKK